MSLLDLLFPASPRKSLRARTVAFDEETQALAKRRNYDRAYRLKNHERLKQQSKERRAKTRERDAARNAAWYQANKARLKAVRRANYLRNREAVLAKQAKYCAEHKEELRAYRKRTQAHKNAYLREWHRRKKEEKQSAHLQTPRP